MNILFVDQFGELGGGQQCLLELIPAVTARGWRSFAAIPRSGELTARLVELGVEVEPISLGEYTAGAKTFTDFARFLVAAPRLAAGLRGMIRRHRIDLVYVNGPRVLPAAALAAGRLPLVFHAHSYLAAGLGSCLVRASLSVCGNANVIAVSEFVASYLCRPAPLWSRFGMGPHDDRPLVEIIPNGVADLRITTAKTGPPRIGVVGRIAPEKGQLDFIEAVRLLPLEWKFLIAGAPAIAAPGYAETVRKQAEGLPIEFLGWQDDLRHLYGQLDLLVVPSAPGEGFGRVIIEAFSAEAPVVAYESGGIVELIEDGVTGYLVRPQTPEALAARIRAAMDDPQGRLEVASRARARWALHFTLEHYRERVTNVIARAASKAIKAATSNTGR